MSWDALYEGIQGNPAGKHHQNEDDNGDAAAGKGNMSDQDAFERILASLYDAMLDDAEWPATSALIDAACGTVGNALVVSEDPPDDTQIHFVGIYHRGQRSEALEREWLDVYQPVNECGPRFLQLPDRQPVPITDLYTAEELQTSLAYNEGLRRLRGQQSMISRLDGPQGGNITWISYDPVSSHGWAAPQLALLKGLLPHIRQFVRVRQALVSAEALDMAETGLLDNTRIGVIHLDRRGQILEANDRARHILRRGDGLSDRSGKLRVYAPAAQARFEQLLAGALPSSGTVAVSGSMTLRRAFGLLPFVVHVKPMGVRQPDYGARRVAALVLIVEPGRRSRIDPGLVAETLGLTLAESQVAVWVAEGQTVREIAAATGRTEATIRYHLHQISQKQGVSRQADLVRLMLSLAEGG